MNAYGGFTPAALVPQKCDNPRTVIRYHRYQRRGSMGGQAHVPLI